MFREAKVVVIGGGTGLSVLLRGLKKFPLDISAIVTVADDGGSTGKLRDIFEIPAPGDIRNVMVSLSKVEPLIESLMQYRFSQGILEGHAMGNLLLTALTDITGNIVDGVQALSKVLNVEGNIIPLTDESVTLMAEFEDGTIIEGESKIDKENKKIKRVFYKKAPKPIKEAIEVIEEADVVILGIGSLYTSIMPNLLLPEIQDALIRTKAKKVYVCNAMEEPGETKGYTASEHLKAINSHIGKNIIDAIILNDENIPEDIQKRYEATGVKEVIIDQEEIEKLEVAMFKHRIVEINSKGEVRHNSIRLASAIYSILLDWEYCC